MERFPLKSPKITKITNHLTLAPLSTRTRKDAKSISDSVRTTLRQPRMPLTIIGSISNLGDQLGPPREPVPRVPPMCIGYTHDHLKNIWHQADK